MNQRHLHSALAASGVAAQSVAGKNLKQALGHADTASMGNR